MHRLILSSLIATEIRFVRKITLLSKETLPDTYTFLHSCRSNANPGSHHVINAAVRVLIDECDFESLHTERILIQTRCKFNSKIYNCNIIDVCYIHRSYVTNISRIYKYN